ncbi:TetR/AcrR family transcriptional regulator [Dyella sp. 7MK23]|uniref:TetR/AcrR family transcriptional regulator n=2 Tax=Dyella acidiphila TaxID=2775866 RepID=A0ABR9GG29_9GAMM|nr:TetR/AcrR family transcriptional regulator [Dyella acidiphila]
MRSGTKKDEPEKKPRGRPRAYDPETALRAAAQAFWKAGYAGTSLDDIAAATGMNRPSLRAAFGDKHDIYIKALSDYWERKFAAMRQAFGHGGSVADTLMSVYDASLAIYFSGDEQVLGCFVVGTAITEAPNDPEIQRLTAEGFRTLDADFEALFKRARAAGELSRDADPKALALLAVATMHSMAVRARAGSSRSELRKLAQKAVSVICG